MNTQELVTKFVINPKIMTMGAGKLSSRYKCQPQDIHTARKLARDIINNESAPTVNTVTSRLHDVKTGNIKLEGLFAKEPLSVEELYDLFKIDRKAYVIQRYWTGLQNNKYKVTIDVKILNNINIESQKEVLLDEIKKYSPKISQIIKKSKQTKYLLELCLFDHHFGKLSHEEESGVDYDLKIATASFKEAVSDLISNIDLERVDRILFPIGNDLLNVDNLTKSTTSGTPQDTDSRFHKMVRVVKKVLIETIDNLSAVSSVDVVVVQGNHDEQSTFMMGEILDAFYYNNKNVTINNNPTTRKYYQYHNNSFLFTHGDKENIKELGMIFAAENPKLWADTTTRSIQIGHFHHNKRIEVLNNQDFQGYSVQILPSLSPADKWHNGKGYISKREAKAFLFHQTKGKIAEFTHTAKY
jgi:hypothetical protein